MSSSEKQQQLYLTQLISQFDCSKGSSPQETGTSLAFYSSKTLSAPYNLEQVQSVNIVLEGYKGAQTAHLVAITFPNWLMLPRLSQLLSKGDNLN